MILSIDIFYFKTVMIGGPICICHPESMQTIAQKLRYIHAGVQCYLELQFRLAHYYYQTLPTYINRTLM